MGGGDGKILCDYRQEGNVVAVGNLARRPLAVSEIQSSIQTNILLLVIACDCRVACISNDRTKGRGFYESKTTKMKQQKTEQNKVLRQKSNMASAKEMKHREVTNSYHL